MSSASRSSSSSTSTWTMAKAAVSTAPRRSSASPRSPSSLSTGGASPSASASSSSARARASVDRRRCSAPASSVLDDEPVSDPTDRLDPPRLAQLPADLVHRLLHAVLKARIRAAPHPLQQLGPRHHLAGPVGQQLEHQQRPAFELQVPVTQTRLAPSRVDVQAPAHDR